VSQASHDFRNKNKVKIITV